MTGADVLIVNSRVDESWSGWVADVVRNTGHPVSRLQDGLANFLDVATIIDRETRAAEQVVVLLSRTGPDFLAEAVAAAHRTGTPLLPVHVDDRPASYPRPLGHLPAVDLTGVPLATAADRLRAALDGTHTGLVRPNHVRRPPPTTDPFVGRESELARLHTALFADRAAVVTGEDGIGKSALAARFVRTHRGRWEHVLWSTPARFADDQLRAITRPKGPALLVVDGAPDYPTVRDRLWPVLLDRDLVNVLVTSRAPDWPDPFRTVALGPLDPESARRLAEHTVPGLSAEWPELGEVPGAVISVAGANPGELAAGREIARLARSADHGFHYLDTDDPAAVATFERAFREVAGDIELLSAGRRPWRRWWRRRTGATAEVPVGAAARLLAALRPVPEAVLTIGSTAFVTTPERAGTPIVSRTLTAAELRNFEQGQRLRADPIAGALGED